MNASVTLPMMTSESQQIVECRWLRSRDLSTGYRNIW